jgi:hypothetical protein
METGNPFKSVGRRLFLLIVGPAAAFLVFAGLYSLTDGHDYHYVDSGLPVTVVDVR